MCLDAYLPYFLSGYWTGRLSGPQKIGEKKHCAVPSLARTVPSLHYSVQAFWGILFTFSRIFILTQDCDGSTTCASLARTVPSLARTVLCLARTIPSPVRTVPSLACTVPCLPRTVPKLSTYFA